MDIKYAQVQTCQQITRAFVVSNTVLQQAQTEQHDESS